MRTSLVVVLVFARLAMTCVEAEHVAPTTAAAQLVRARVRGLERGDLMIRLGDGAGIAVPGDGAIPLGTLAAGETYHVEVMHQPALPAQLCMVRGGTGVISAEPVWVDIDCVTLQYPVGGYVVGLAGRGLALAINGNERIDISADGGFAFPHSLASGSSYDIQIASQPSGPTQTCRVQGGTGMITAAGVSTVLVVCAVDRFAVGGTVYGLAGRLVLYSSEGDRVELTAAGSFTIPSTLASGSAYSLAILEQPTDPAQSCAITSGASGVVEASDITSIEIDCKTKRFGISGHATGMIGTGLLLELDGHELASPDATGAFSFYARIPSGQAYSVAVVGQPSTPVQSCTVTSGATGTVGAADVVLQVSCTTDLLVSEP